MRVQRMFLFLTLTFGDPMCDGEQLHQVLRNKREHVNNARTEDGIWKIKRH